MPPSRGSSLAKLRSKEAESGAPTAWHGSGTGCREWVRRHLQDSVGAERPITDHADSKPAVGRTLEQKMVPDASSGRNGRKESLRHVAAVALAAPQQLRSAWAGLHVALPCLGAHPQQGLGGACASGLKRKRPQGPPPRCLHPLFAAKPAVYMRSVNRRSSVPILTQTPRGPSADRGASAACPCAAASWPP